MGNEQPTGIPETLDFMEHRIEATFSSKENMKIYYLQLANHTRAPHLHYYQGSEYVTLKKLSNRLRKFAVFTQALGEHEWERGIAGIQKALGIYMMQNDVDAKVRRKTNEEVTAQLQFLVFLAENTSLVKQLQGMLTDHYSNITYLLKSMPVEEEQE